MGDPGRSEVQPPTVRYPAELERDAVTKVGTVVRVRPIRPDDADGLVAFHGRLSTRSIYRRFFFMHLALTPKEVSRFTTVDYVNRMAFVASDGGELVAVGRYERAPGTTEAEVAFVVVDEYQHHGIGTLLLESLAEAAWTNGITVFTAQTLSENHDMLSVFAHSGFAVTTASAEGTVTVRFPIRPDETYRRSRASRHDRAAQARRAAGETS